MSRIVVMTVIESAVRPQCRARRRRGAVSLAALAAVAAIAGWPAPARAGREDALLTGERRTPVVRVVERARPAVVNIYTETRVETPFRGARPFSDPFAERLFPDMFGIRPRVQQRQSLGTGVIVDAKGTIVTNEHVIVQASTIRVLMADKREFTAELIGADSDFDLAVIKIDADESLPYVSLPEKDEILIGETVVAIGNPYGLSHTVTVGVVSAVGRTIHSGDVLYRDFIQTDASINPGNSGGPLLNIEGDLVGINTAIFSEAQGIGFAIPATRARHVVDQIIGYGSVQPPWIGLSVQEITPDLAYHFGVEAGIGVLIAGVEEQSPAAAAGLVPGQIIDRVDGDGVGTAAQFDRRTSGVTAGDEIELSIRDDGKLRDVRVRVGALPIARIDAFAWEGLGVGFEDHPKIAGVVVSKVRRGSPAEQIGLAAGDVIAAVGGREIMGADDFRRGLAGVRNSNQVLISVVRGRRLYRVTIPVERATVVP